MSSIAEKLELARKDLLDLSMRNNLLNFRPLKSRGVEVIDELSKEVYSHLVIHGRSMTFLPDPRREDERAADELEQELLQVIEETDEAEEGIAARHVDDKLQTPYGRLGLQRRAKQTFGEARISIEELGVNTLYLALGSLLWFESESSEIERRAPLILIPVELNRPNIRGDFRLRFSGDEIGENLSLKEKLRLEFGIELPDFPTDSEDLDIEEYAASLEGRITKHGRWSVNKDKISLGFFSFAKLLMFEDLGADVWPENHAVLGKLLGEGFEPDPASLAEGEVDHFQHPPHSYQVVDADSSQTEAIVNASRGQNLVIQGPPGTGKSQTITNLIADSLGRGKKVLFVAEKMAALEVVKRRLDAVGLGDAALELHSQKSNKKAVLEELRRTQQLGKPKLRDAQDDIRSLEISREQLNGYVKALNEPVGETYVTPRQSYGELLKIAEHLPDSTPTLPRELFQGWDQSRFRELTESLHNLQSLLSKMGTPADHPFWGVGLRIFLPTREADYRSLILEAKNCLSELVEAAESLGSLIPLIEVHLRRDLDLTLAGARQVLKAPEVKSITWGAPQWKQSGEKLCEALRAGKRVAAQHAKHSATLTPQAWKVDALSLRIPLAAHGQKLWRFLYSDYRSARSKLKGLCRENAPKAGRPEVEAVDAILDAQENLERFSAQEDALSQAIDLQAFEEIKWDQYLAAADWLVETHDRISRGTLPAGLPDLLDTELDRTGISAACDWVESQAQAYDGAMGKVFECLEFQESVRWPGAGWKEQTSDHQEQVLEQWIAELPRLHEITRWNAAVDELDQKDSAAISDSLAHWDRGGDSLVSWVSKAWHSTILEKAFEERPVLALFQGDTHAETVQRFRRLDEAILFHNRHLLADEHWNKMPRHLAGGQASVLAREFQKKRRHLPLRQLMSKAGNVVQGLKPIFMMSPMSIARFIRPLSLNFDVVIFDEASQVEPVDAFGAILRGDQTIVVGDSKQLPPTSFFQRITEEEQDEESTGDLESILGLFCAQGVLQQMLRWHYRSQHESLIMVSNSEFYDNRLVVFPSPDCDVSNKGLEFIHLPETYYESGSKRRYNTEEARAVAHGVMDHARSTPDLTLGVAAFSKSQARVIEEHLEILRRRDSQYESFFHGRSDEPFFVKNLENVQGDERDVILVSLGYGRTREGLMSMSFGPVNKDGGERRLNVLITRARRRCAVYSNFTADDIDLNRTQARGVKALKSYLRYAESGILDVPTPDQADSDSPFEDHVYEKLSDCGYQVHRQIGSGGFFIDLAVVDPEKPGRYLLGIECDGASYHSSKSARDRDRIRQMVLERLGWKLHRIWSTDWFRDPEAELKKAIIAIEGAKTTLSVQPGGVENASPPPSPPKIERLNQIAAKPIGELAQPYQMIQFEVNLGTVQLHEVPHSQMATWVQRVVDAESPIHFDEVTRRIAHAAGLARTGSRIRKAVNNAARLAVRQRTILKRGSFGWSPDMKVCPIRDRSGTDLPLTIRKISGVAPEEIGRAVTAVVQASYGIELGEAITETARLIGFNRTGKDVSKGIGSVIRDLLKRGRLDDDGGHLKASSEAKGLTEPASAGRVSEGGSRVPEDRDAGRSVSSRSVSGIAASPDWIQTLQRYLEMSADQRQEFWMSLDDRQKTYFRKLVEQLSG